MHPGRRSACVLLHLVSSQNDISWYLIFADRNFTPHLVVWFVLEIRWRLCITLHQWCRTGILFLTQNLFQIHYHEYTTREIAASRKLIFRGSWSVVKLHPGISDALPSGEIRDKRKYVWCYCQEHVYYLKLYVCELTYFTATWIVKLAVA